MAVYIAMRATDGAVKIGTSSDPEKRLKQLSWQEKSVMITLRVMDGSYVEERWMHMRFGAECICGEWFNFSADMMSVIIPDDCENQINTYMISAGKRLRDWIQSEERLVSWLAAKFRATQTP